MFNGFSKAFKLEINDMKQRKWNLIFYLIVPIFIIWIFFISASSPLPENFGVDPSLGIRLYDFSAPYLFSILIVFITMQLTILRIVAERAPYGTLDRELIAISRSGMYFGKLMANFMFAVVQSFMIYLAGYQIFPAKNFASFSSIMVFLVW